MLVDISVHIYIPICIHILRMASIYFYLFVCPFYDMHKMYEHICKCLLYAYKYLVFHAWNMTYVYLTVQNKLSTRGRKTFLLDE